MTEDDHNHQEYAAVTGIICSDCGKAKWVCALCNKDLHRCEKAKNPRLPRGFRVIPDFPDYMVNNQATVLHISSGKYCMLVRVSKQGGAMINLRRDGKTFTRAAQDLRKAAFGEQYDS